MLMAEGHIILFKSCTVKRGPCFVGLDFADLFDIVSVYYKVFPILENEVIQPRWLFLSLKHEGSDNGGLTQHREMIREFAKENGLPGMSFELWRWRKPGYHGRGKNKAYCRGEFLKEVLA
jgi:hypothetical protein